MARGIIFAYGLISYLIFFVTFLYAIAFVGNFPVPRTIDSGFSASTGVALLIDAVLLSIFAVQHSVMARPAFKRAWTRMIPNAAERSTYVLLSSFCLILLFWQWRPITLTVWEVQNSAGSALLWLLFWLGWLLVLIGTFMIDHFELFGLRQVFFHVQGREYEAIEFKESMLYKYCRHPIMLGFLIAFWATPHMTIGHLVFAIATGAYILLAIQFEEHDLIAAHGERYRQYRGRTSMLLPMMRRDRS